MPDRCPDCGHPTHDGKQCETEVDGRPCACGSVNERLFALGESAADLLYAAARAGLRMLRRTR